MADLAKSDHTLNLAVVGLGPRGLGALEALIVRAKASGVKILVDAFDADAHPGAGPNFSPDQTEHCLLNTPMRALDIAPDPELGASIATFDKAPTNADGSDHFPTRAALGAYLERRFSDVLAANAQTITLRSHSEVITDAEQRPDGVVLQAGKVQFGPYDEVLLTLGQPKTRPDEQLAGWIEHAASSEAILHPAYPDRDLLKAAQDWAGEIVAIRGLGLSTMDVLRILTAGVGGTFSDKGYQPSGREPARILPFSLDGQPPAPKPEDATVDAVFDISEAEDAAVADALARAVTQPPEAALTTFCNAVTPPALRILRDTGSTASQTDVADWLLIECDAPGTQTDLSPLKALTHNIAMAEGRTPPDIAFTVGQVMRKLENTVRKVFNPATVPPDTAQALVTFNEGLGRYSYGPPLRSAKELLMLVEAGVVSLIEAEDPDIEVTNGGWTLREHGVERTATVMVDAVIPPPNLPRVSDPLFASLQSQGWITPVEDGLGLRTAADGRLIPADGQKGPDICLLGRMALGSVIAVDSIHDCFGAATHRWADGVLDRIAKNTAS